MRNGRGLGREGFKGMWNSLVWIQPSNCTVGRRRLEIAYAMHVRLYQAVAMNMHDMNFLT